MAGVGGFRGVSADQDVRYTNKTKKAMSQIKFPKELDTKVDVKALRAKTAGWAVIQEWIAKRITQLLGGLEEEVLISFIFNQLESNEAVKPKEVHVSLIPFLEKNTSLFMKELWSMLISAAENPSGVPQQLLDEKAAQLEAKRAHDAALQERIEAQRAAASAAAAAVAASTVLPPPPALPGGGLPPPPASGRSSRWDAKEVPRGEVVVKQEVKEEGRVEVKTEEGAARQGNEPERRRRGSRSRSRSPDRRTRTRRSRSRSRSSRSRSRSRSPSRSRSRSRSRDRRYGGDRGRDRSPPPYNRSRPDYHRPPPRRDGSRDRRPLSRERGGRGFGGGGRGGFGGGGRGGFGGGRREYYDRDRRPLSRERDSYRGDRDRRPVSRERDRGGRPGSRERDGGREGRGPSRERRGDKGAGGGRGPSLERRGDKGMGGGRGPSPERRGDKGAGGGGGRGVGAQNGDRDRNVEREDGRGSALPRREQGEDKLLGLPEKKRAAADPESDPEEHSADEGDKKERSHKSKSKSKKSKKSKKEKSSKHSKRHRGDEHNNGGKATRHADSDSGSGDSGGDRRGSGDEDDADPQLSKLKAAALQSVLSKRASSSE